MLTRSDKVGEAEIEYREVTTNNSNLIIVVMISLILLVI